MNTQRKHEILNEIDTLRKRVELLESHKTVGMITDDQYIETGLSLLNRVRELEEECGINTPIFTSQGVLYEDQAELFEDEYNKKAHEEIEDIESLCFG